MSVFRVLLILRLAALGWTCLCALIMLGVGAHTLDAAGDLGLPVFAWAGLAVATAILALASLPAMLIVDTIRTGAFTSMIVVELAWLGFLGVMLLATGAAAASNASGFWVQCGAAHAAIRTVCNETSAAAAFGFLGWVAIWAYTGTLLVVLIIHAQRGDYIWQSSVKEMESKAGSSIPPAATTTPGLYGSEQKPVDGQGQVPYAYPPQNTMSPQSTGTLISPQSTGYQQPYAQQTGGFGQPAQSYSQV